MSEDIIEKDKIMQKIGEVIINLNLIEGRIAELIVLYIQSKKSDFLRDVVLNSLVVGFASKLRILEVIINSEQITSYKKLLDSLKTLMQKRNHLAHSDSANKVILLIDEHEEYDELMIKSFKYGEPEIKVVNNGTISFENLGKIVRDFEKHYSIADKEIENLSKEISKLLAI